MPSVGCCLVRPRSSSFRGSSRIRLSWRARTNTATSCSGVSASRSACCWFGSKSTNCCPVKKAWTRTGKTWCSASTKCCKQRSADHSPAAGGRVSRSVGSVLTSRCQRSGVVERTASTCSTKLFNEHLLLSFPRLLRASEWVSVLTTLSDRHFSCLNHTTHRGCLAIVA